MEKNKPNVLNSFNFRVIAFFVLVSLYLVIKWMPSGQIIGGGDVGIPVYAPEKVLNEQSFAWWDTHASGISSATTYTALPFYIILSFLERIGFNQSLNQQIVFFSILFGGALSIYFLSLQFYLGRWTSLTAGLFYIFNLTALSVWQRGVHNAMLMFLLAPLSLLILVYGINSKKYVSILWLNIVSFLLSYVFGALGYVFSLWLLWAIYLLIVLCTEWTNKPKRKFILSFYFILAISWIGTNAWWILHLLQSSNYALGQFSQDELKSRGSDVLTGLKPYHQPQFILRGLSAFYLYGVKDWGNSYLNPFIVLLSWIPTIIVFYSTLFRTNYKSTSWKFLIITIFIVLFLSKGVNPPWGLLNALPYDLFPFLAPLRNPYEKVGILLAIPYSLLFAQGLFQIISFLRFRRMHYLSLLTILIGILCLTILVWPLWLGKLFVSEGRKYTVSIPSYYKEANNWLKEKVLVEDTRILHLPLSWGESVDYNWDYTGIEPSQYFFNGSSIGYQIGVSSVDSRIRDILIAIHKQDSLSVQKAIASLNVGWLVVHNETVWRPRILESPERINTWLSTKPDFLEYQIDFGPLSIWRVKDQYRIGHIFTTDKLISLNRVNPQASLNIWDKIDKLNDSFITEKPEAYKNLLDKFINEVIIRPTKKSTYSPLPTINRESAIDNLATVSILPDSVFYSLETLKENLLPFINQGDPVVNCFILSGKRLKETILFANQNKFEAAKKSLTRYERQLDKCSKIGNDTVIAYMGGSMADLTLGQLIRQKTVLEEGFNNTQLTAEAKIAKDKLIRYLSDLGLAPRFDFQKVDNNKQRLIFNYLVSEEGNYKIKFPKPDQALGENSPKIVLIDGQSVDLTPESEYNFNQGFHEIHLEMELNKNLLDEQILYKESNPDSGFTHEVDPASQKNIFTGKAISELKYLAFDFTNLNIEQNYELSFDLFLSQGVPPFITITHDSDPVDTTGSYIPAVKGQVLYGSDLPDSWKRIKIPYQPTLNSTLAKLSLIITPPAEIKFRNIALIKTSANDLVLEKINNLPIQKMDRSGVVWKKIDPTLYEATMNNQKQPFILVFSETFHPLWKVYDSANTIINLPHISINGYANAWLVADALPEKIKIKFILQNTRDAGIAISITSLFLLISAVLYLDRKNLND